MLLDYKKIFETHVSEEFRRESGVIDYLKSEEAIAVFVPEIWNRLAGFTELELEFRDDMPTNMRPSARPINSTLYQNALQEFERLRAYIFTDSDSEVAYPRVVAPKATTPFIRLYGDYREINK